MHLETDESATVNVRLADELLEALLAHAVIKMGARHSLA